MDRKLKPKVASKPKKQTDEYVDITDPPFIVRLYHKSKPGKKQPGKWIKLGDGIKSRTSSVDTLIEKIPKTISALPVDGRTELNKSRLSFRQLETLTEFFGKGFLLVDIKNYVEQKNLRFKQIENWYQIVRLVEDDIQRVRTGYKEKDAGNERQIWAGTQPVEAEQPAQTEQQALVDEGLLKKSANIFMNTGDFWQVAYKDSELKTIEDSPGMSYIHYLLLNPNKPFSAFNLESPQNQQIGFNNPQEILDNQGMLKLHQRLIEIKHEIIEAEHNYKHSKALELKDERENIEKQLKASVKSDGKSRNFPDELKKANDRVRIAIKRALDNIKEHNINLFQHLKNSIQLKTPFTYTPENEIIWEL